MKDKLAFAFAAASTAVTLFIVPSWNGFLTDPCLWALAAAMATILLLLITRHLGDRARLFEVRLGVISWRNASDLPCSLDSQGWSAAGSGWLLVELVGVLVYVMLAILGLKYHWLIVAGIAAHGLAWD